MAQLYTHTIRRMRFACSISKAADTHSEYIMLIAFVHKQWLPKRVSILCLRIRRFSCLSYCKYRNISLFHKYMANYWIRTTQIRTEERVVSTLIVILTKFHFCKKSVTIID